MTTGETLRLSLHRPSIKSVFKHWIAEKGYSVICTGINCSYCQHTIPKRPRYNASILIDGEGFRWEFGDEVYLQLPESTNKHGWLNLKITRAGSARRTKYNVIEYDPDLPSDTPLNIFKCTLCHGYIFPFRYHNDKLPQCSCRSLSSIPAKTTHTS